MYLEIRNQRLEKGWTLEFVGQKVGVSKQAVSDIENNRRKPSYRVLVKLEDLFNRGHRELFAISKSTKIARRQTGV